MEIHIRKSDLVSETSDVLVLSVYQEKQTFASSAAVEKLDARLGGLLTQIAKEESFVGKANQTMWARIPDQLASKRILLVGLGKKEECDLETIRLAAATVLNSMKQTTTQSVSCLLFGETSEVRERAHAMIEGVRLADYGFGRYKKQKKMHLKSFDLLLEDGRDLVAAKKGVEQAEQFAKGTLFVRDLVNTPGLHMAPQHLVDEANNIAKNNKQIKIKVYNEEKLAKMGAGGILGVSQGSDHPSFLVHMTYTPVTKSKKRIALVGKGVTFDSGGLSLKPSAYMATMKCDMAGAADVLGVFSVLSAIAPKVEVHGIFAAVENMPSGKAMRPGDIIEFMNKKTAEVLDTDAEGRLILADALVYATRQKPDAIIDLATLTGACVVALGEEITGVMSNTPALSNALLSAAASAGEKMWELPLEKNYRKQISGDFSDLKNIGPRYGGALTAGLFLEEFVDKTPWAHLDIAGPAFAERDYNAYEKKGATGHGVRTLLKYLLSF
ncbi:MAG: leucyl aminopeptidase [Candidatus Uhrbacteria bacterium]|nr:leucyl aminopeptidase [Candidatus Uhrbacteria bacterium]